MCGFSVPSQSGLRVRIRTASITCFKANAKTGRFYSQRSTNGPRELLQRMERMECALCLIDAMERTHATTPKASPSKKYSGKGFHTANHTTVSETDQPLLRLGDTVPGSQHGDSLLLKRGV